MHQTRLLGRKNRLTRQLEHPCLPSLGFAFKTLFGGNEIKQLKNHAEFNAVDFQIWHSCKYRFLARSGCINGLCFPSVLSYFAISPFEFSN